MAEIIYQIPINEAFEEEGCPFCLLTASLEKSSLEYIMGAAMMEPELRLETNRLGFCGRHLGQMKEGGSRLSLALLLQSHLAELEKRLSPSRSTFSARLAKRPEGGLEGLEGFDSSCFICSKVSAALDRHLSNAAHMWKSDRAFREKLEKHNGLCLRHLIRLAEAGAKSLGARDSAALQALLAAKARQSLGALRANVEDFCGSFDHRRSKEPLSEAAKGSIDKTREFLSHQGLF